MDAPRALIIVRHGESEHHVRRLTGGWTDTPLTALGHEQAQRVAARLRDELAAVPVRLYSSDLQRAWQTAEHIGEALGVKPTADARLREHNNGAAANLTFDEAKARFPDVWGRVPGVDERPFPEAETWREFYDRVAPFADELGAEGGVPIAVTHGGTITNLIVHWLGLPLSVTETANFETRPTSLFVLRVDGSGRRAAERLNDCAHLDGTDGHASIGLVVRSA
jgi:probable phosphoglycerate mutase